MTEFEKILQRMKSILRVTSDAEVARIIGMKPSAFANRKKTDSIPYIHFINAVRSENVNMDWLITGDGPMYKEPDIEKEDAHGTSKTIIEHQNVVKKFKDPEKAKEFNEFLVIIEDSDPKGYEELYREAKAIAKTIKRLTGNLSASNSERLGRVERRKAPRPKPSKTEAVRKNGTTDKKK